jgi:hypothetical protein
MGGEKMAHPEENSFQIKLGYYLVGSSKNSAYGPSLMCPFQQRRRR